MTIHIGILETGRTPIELASSYPSYAQMTADWLTPINGEVSIYPIMDGITPPAPEQADLWAITGSKCGVYEDHPWIPGLIKFVQDAKTYGKTKMLGICFGHQLIATALGGTVIKSDKGWGIGIHRYSTAPWPEHLGKAPKELAIAAFHQDQVIEPPPGSQIIARSEFCNFAGLYYPGFGMSIQPHPEFDVNYEESLIKLRHASGLLSDEIAKPALETLRGDCNRLALGDLFVEQWQKL